MLTCLHALNGCVRAHTQGKDRTASFPAGKRDFIPYGVCSNVTSKIGLSMIVIITEHSLLKWLQHWEMKVDTTDSKPYHSCDIAPVTANGGGGVSLVPLALSRMQAGKFSVKPYDTLTDLKEWDGCPVILF